MKLPPYTLASLEESLEALHRQALLGCSDGGCKIRGTTTGQHTNAGCRCKPREFARTLRNIASRLDEYGYRDF